MLSDEERTIIKRQYNIAPLITINEEANGMIVIKSEIDDPDPLPEVIRFEDDSGFGSSAADWKEIVIPIYEY